MSKSFYNWPATEEQKTPPKPESLVSYNEGFPKNKTKTPQRSHPKPQRGWAPQRGAVVARLQRHGPPPEAKRSDAGLRSSRSSWAWRTRSSKKEVSWAWEKWFLLTFCGMVFFLKHFLSKHQTSIGIRNIRASSAAVFSSIVSWLGITSTHYAIIFVVGSLCLLLGNNIVMINNQILLVLWCPL